MGDRAERPTGVYMDLINHPIPILITKLPGRQNILNNYTSCVNMSTFFCEARVGVVVLGVLRRGQYKKRELGRTCHAGSRLIEEIKEHKNHGQDLRRIN